MALSPQRRYQNELARYGLGLGGLQFNPKKQRTVFAEEGPASYVDGSNSIDQKQVNSLAKRLEGSGLSLEEIRKKLNAGTPTTLGVFNDKLDRGIGSLGIPSDIDNMPELAQAYANIMETVRPQNVSSLSDEEKKARSIEIGEMPEDSEVFAESPLDVIAAQIAKAETPANSGSEGGTNDGEIAQSIITKKRAEAGLAEEARLFDDIGVDKEDTAMEDALIGSMNPYLEAINKKIPTAESREDLIKKYKKEFSEATGIEIDGKVDKSQALMAMGLSLMQNRAGKGFNVGKILNAVGQAGEKALPALEKAKTEAKAAQLASGRYALDKIAKGESATAAFNAEARASAESWMLEKFKASNAIKLEEIKAGGESNEMKNVAPVPIGAGDLKVRIGDKGGVSVFASGPTDAGAIVNAYTKYTEGQENIDIMNDALSAIASKDSSALSTLSDRAKSVGVAWGVVDGVDMFGPKGVSDEAEFNKYRQATINAFKRLILQESQVSNLDLTTLFASFGDVKFMQNPKEAELAIELMNQYFASKKRSLEPVLTDFHDRSWFRSDEDYNRTQEKLSKINKVFDPKVTSEAGGRMTLDLSTIPTLKNIEEAQ